MEEEEAGGTNSNSTENGNQNEEDSHFLNEDASPAPIVETNEQENEGQEEEEEQQVSSFPEEDSMSRDSSALHGDSLGDESRNPDTNNDEAGRDPISDKMDFMDEGQSLDAVSLQSEENNVALAENSEDKDPTPTQPEAIGEESSDSKMSNTSKEKATLDDQSQPSQQDSETDGLSHLISDETLLDEDDNEENVVSEVDISSMMEINFDEDSENNQTQNGTENDEDPEVIPIESDDETVDTRKTAQQNGTIVDSTPILDEAIYRVDDDENITEMVTEVDVSSMIQVEVALDEDTEESRSSANSTPNRRPRRAAAEAAAKTIHQISTEEQGVSSSVFRTRRKSQEDGEFSIHEERTHGSTSQSQGVNQKCLVCKKSVPCSIVIRQYGSDVYLCSNPCFNKFRNQGQDSRGKTLPCSKCGIMEGESSDSKTVFFWETMNFCSDICVGRYQMDVGSKCCTCGNNVPWNSLGKYCVRFGSDIRQFCVPQCLESYKKNARVCFNCQLDIRRSGNVILANIPSKTSPKEFCSNDCVEMYCDRNMHQPTRAKPQPEHFCCICNSKRPVHRELVLANGNFKACSESCWKNALYAKGIVKAEKCEMCAKFVNMDLGFSTPVYWLSTMNRIYGFCSHVCKNLYILNSRKILSCTTCKVKKYNFDLIEYFKNSASTYAICSLACLPKAADYLKNIRDVLYLPQPTSDKATIQLVTSSVPGVSSVGEDKTRSRARRKHYNGGPGLRGGEVIEINDDDEDIVDSDNILDVLSIEEIEAVVKFLESRSKTRDVKCMAKPRTRTVETQTDVSELNDMGRIPLVPDDIVHYVPVPIPTLVHVPFPGYFVDSPVPVPFPIPIPIPIPIPVIIPTKKESSPSFKSAKDDDDNDDTGKNKDSNSKQTPPLTTAARVSTNITTTAAATGTSVTSQPASEKQSELEKEQKSYSEVKIAREHEHHIKNNISGTSIPNPITPTPSMPTTPDYTRRGGPGSTYSFPSPNYSQENAYQTSIFPSPISNYSPTFGSSPVPPLTPVAPLPVGGPPITNHTPPMKDYGPPSIPPIAPQMSGTYSSFDMPPRPYMPTTVPIIRPPAMPVGSGYGTHSSTTSMGYANAPPPSLPLTNLIPQPPTPKNARVENALRAWKMMFGPSSDPRSISSMELSSKLCDLVNRGSKPNGERYRADILLYISLGIQQLLRDNNRVDKIFYDNMYYNFVLAFTDRAERELTVGIHAKLEEIHFWETSELGATSPGVLLFTLIFMLYRHFGLKTWEMHASLQFSNVVVQSRYNHFGRIVKYMTVVGVPGVIPTEIPEDLNTPDRCLIKMYEFYCFKSENQIGPFYKCLRQDYTPRTPWFTSQQLDQRHIYQMLVRASMISNSDSFS